MLGGCAVMTLLGAVDGTNRRIFEGAGVEVVDQLRLEFHVWLHFPCQFLHSLGIVLFMLQFGLECCCALQYLVHCIYYFSVSIDAF